MKQQTYLFMTSLLFLAAIQIQAQKIVFLHHSTGGNVYSIGQVAAWIGNYNSANGTNYTISEKWYPGDPYPANNYPYDYWNLWVNKACNNNDADIECLDKLTSTYDVVVFKHCFPGSAIEPDDQKPDISSAKQTLANYKLQYRALRTVLDEYAGTKFIVWTLPPLHRLITDAASAARARQFVDWVKNEWLTEDGKAHPNIYIFDFFSLVAELNATPAQGKVNCLKYDYEISHSENDSHPNYLANETAGPIFAQFIVNVLEERPNIAVQEITVSGAGGQDQIDTPGGTLQLHATIMPDDATVKSVTWSVLSGTGTASVGIGGLVTAHANGMVTIKAGANDGSGVTGEMNVIISNQNPTGVSESQERNPLVFQNQSRQIEIQTGYAETYQWVTVYDVFGRLVSRHKIADPTMIIELAAARGIYIVSLTGETKNYSCLLNL